MEQVFDLLVVDLKEHDAHSAACCALLGFNAFEQLPAMTAVDPGDSSLRV